MQLTFCSFQWFNLFCTHECNFAAMTFICMVFSSKGSIKHLLVTLWWVKYTFHYVNKMPLPKLERLLFLPLTVLNWSSRYIVGRVNFVVLKDCVPFISFYQYLIFVQGQCASNIGLYWIYGLILEKLISFNFKFFNAFELRYSNIRIVKFLVLQMIKGVTRKHHFYNDNFACKFRTRTITL